MEDVVTRSITIGAGVFIAIITISAVMTYYSASRDMVRAAGPGVDIADLYNKNIAQSLEKNRITGTEAKNILYYYLENNNVQVSMNGKANINNLDGGIDNSVFKSEIRGIYPNQSYNLTKSRQGNATVITIVK
ncbi:MAG: hypothetical protein RSE00_00930 [Clostridia bacterium]